MKCPKCGYPVLPKFTKCPHCGESLIKEDNNTNLPDANDFSIVKGRAIGMYKREKSLILSKRLS